MEQRQSKTMKSTTDTFDDLDKIMASHLPPRSVYHKEKEELSRKKHKEEKKKEKRSYFIIKTLVFLFLLLPIIIGFVFLMNELNSSPFNPTDPVSENFDHVHFE